MSQETEVEQRVVAIIVGVIIAAVVALAIGFGIAQTRGGSAATGAAATAAAETDGARVVVDNGVVKFYFASGQADVASDGAAALTAAVAAAQAGQQLSISGYHDSTGDAAMNAELAKQRALAVQALLLQAGVDAARIELKKPEAAQGSGDNAEARRVEVVVAP